MPTRDVDAEPGAGGRVHRLVRDITCAFTDRSTDTDGTIAAWSWAFGAGSAYVASPSFKFAAPGTYHVALTVADDDGATRSVTNAVEVTGRLHAAYAGSTKKWSSASGLTNYWSAEVVLTAHGLDERPIAGAAVTAAWTGAVTKTATCVTSAAGSCVLKSGTLSYGRSTVTLSVTGVAALNGVYDPKGNHTPTAAGALTAAISSARLPGSTRTAAGRNSDRAIARPGRTTSRALS